jgi:hypothetical protein
VFVDAAPLNILRIFANIDSVSIVGKIISFIILDRKLYSLNVCNKVANFLYFIN